MTEAEFYTDTVGFVDVFAEWAGNNEIHSQALTIMWMGWRTRDINILASLTGYDIPTITYFAERAISNKIWINNMKMAADAWFVIPDGNGHDDCECMMAILLDMMVVAGEFDISDDQYVISDQITDMCKVQCNSGRGSYFKVADIRMREGHRQIRLKRARNTGADTGPWRPALNYIIKE